LAQANDIIRGSKLPANSPLCTRIIHYHNLMITSFERMRTVREYRTPRNIRSFCKIVVFCLPSLLAPWYAFLSRKGAMDLHPFNERHYMQFTETDFNQRWSAYYTCVLFSLIFGSMQSVQDALDDPFDGIAEDDIDLHLVTAWPPTALWENSRDQKVPVMKKRDDRGEVLSNLLGSEHRTEYQDPTATILGPRDRPRRSIFGRKKKNKRSTLSFYSPRSPQRTQSNSSTISSVASLFKAKRSNRGNSGPGMDKDFFSPPPSAQRDTASSPTPPGARTVMVPATPSIMRTHSPTREPSTERKAVTFNSDHLHSTEV